MSSTYKSIVIKAPLKQIHKIITDFESYPDFFPEVLSAKIIKKGGKSVQVAFKLNLIMEISCTLIFDIASKKISWTLIKGDFMKKNQGCWQLEVADKLTKVTYSIEIVPSGWVPRSIIENLINTNIPTMLKHLKMRCE